MHFSHLLTRRDIVDLALGAGIVVAVIPSAINALLGGLVGPSATLPVGALLTVGLLVMARRRLRRLLAA